jgi:membrane-bound lytic murein transglycosylase MltF
MKKIDRRRPTSIGLLAAAIFGAMLFCLSATGAEVQLTQLEGLSQLNEKWLGDFDEMAKKRQIRVLVAYSKTFFFLDRGRQRGISHDFLKEFEKLINKKLKTKTLKVQVVFIPVRRDELIPGLVQGLGDLAVANLTITPQRRKHVDFSNPLMSGVKELPVSGLATRPMSGIDSLAGQEIHVRKSSSYYESLVKLNETFEKTGKSQMELIPVDEAFEDEDLLEMVNAGIIPMIVMDSHKARFWTQIFDKIQVHDDIAVRTGGEIAWAFRKNSPQLKAVVNQFVKGHKKGSLIGNMLLKRYLKSTKYVKNSVSKDELQKFEQMVELFKRYAETYEFDYLLMAAMAYQESGLDQSKKSHAGAIGVMQLLPSTAADRNVNISEIQKLENNIHAGTKYMRFIVNRYYQDEPMDDVNKMLFAFASYNAGPAKVNKLRKKAAAMGLNPNLWFHNVEVAAAKVIGRETVQYVSNIYKYYIAYHMITEQEKRRRNLMQDK